MAVNEHDTDAGRAEERRIAALYREAAVEQPPPRLDALIRSAAGDSTERSGAREKRNAWWQTWRVPFALASVAVLSVSVVTLMQREGGDPLTLEPVARAPGAAQRDLPPPAAETAAPASPQTASSEPTAGSGETTTTGRLMQRAEPGERASRADGPMISGAPQSAVAPRTEPAVRDAPERDARKSRAGPQAARDALAGTGSREQTAASSVEGVAGSERQTPSEPAFATKSAQPAPSAVAPPSSPRAFPKATPAEAASSESSPMAAAKRPGRQAVPGMSPAVAALIADLEAHEPARWIERVLELRRDGRAEDADALLAEFKRRYPDEALPPSLR